MPGAANSNRARRVLAAFVDAGIGLLVALLLTETSGHYFASRAAETLRIGMEGTLWRGPIPLALGVVGRVSYGLPFALCVVLLAEPLTGRSPGKALLGLRVTTRHGERARPTPRWKRFVAKTLPLWGLTFAWVLGAWPLAALSVVAGAVVVAGCMPLLAPRSSALHDRVAGTRVQREITLPQASFDPRL